MTALPPLLVEEEGRPAAKCPYQECGAVDRIAEEDRAVRWNSGELIIENGRIVAAAFSAGQSDFEHQRFVCRACGGEIALPDDLDEHWS